MEVHAPSDMLRLWFDEQQHQGQAVCDGVSVRLHSMPQVTGLPAHLTILDYFGGRGELRVSGAERRPLTWPECEAVREHLQRMASTARAAAEAA
jgi:hypothetical protein